jgi:multidrug efflux system membrane fusion protein
LVVNAENLVERRSVETGQRIDGLIVIEDGLQKDDRVVVKGVQRARPGRKVDPQTVDMSDLTTSALTKVAEEAEQAARIRRSEPEPPTQETGGEP